MPHFGNLYGLTRNVDKSLNHEDLHCFRSGHSYRRNQTQLPGL
jgi:hypothetical protein